MTLLCHDAGTFERCWGRFEATTLTITMIV